MDLSQTKLSKAEWESVEVPVDDAEKDIMSMIVQGYHIPNVCINPHLSLYEYLKIPPSPEMDEYLFAKYFLPEISAHMPAAAAADSNKKAKAKVKPPNKADMIRMQKADQLLQSNRAAIFEFVLIDAAIQALKGKVANIYSILLYRDLHIRNLNPCVIRFIDDVVLPSAGPDDPAKIHHLVLNARECIEKNGDLIKYGDKTLYSHQKQLFEIFGKDSASKKKLVLYMAPTGTGKTLSPIGLSEEYRVIFVCVARHVGLALAKSAISVNKRVAFAFGCETADDIRLHYFAAADYTVNKRSGGIYKVDNSNGSRVEIMICDVASYLVAMYYMKSFHSEHRIVTYWDEPTISMDYETHDLHEVISRNWRQNQIGKMVLSCATLPKSEEIEPTIQSFREKFTEYDEETGDPVVPEIHTIDSFDCKKTIAIQNKMGATMLPHMLFDTYRDIMRCADHCDANKTLLRYFDVDSIAAFLKRVEMIGGAVPAEWLISSRFKKMRDVTLFSIKTHYLDVLRNLQIEWDVVLRELTLSCEFAHLHSVDSIRGSIRGSQQPQNQNVFSGTALRRTASQSPSLSQPATPGPAEQILITTRDAHTLTDGPTIFLAEDVNKIGQFYIQQSKIPESILQKIQETIDKNNVIAKRVNMLEREMTEKGDKGNGNGDGKKQMDSRKAEKEPATKEMQRLQDQIEQHRELIQIARLPAIYVPNTLPHQNIWLNPTGTTVSNAFVPNVDDDDVREIMALSIDNSKKILLILGIGVFSNETDNVEYMEVMKRLAYSQSLFLIIAASDYIYGTNYQFCHGFIGKDLLNMTQQKTIQAIGRIGRNSMQQEYTVRFRDDAILRQLFKKMETNLEARIMTRLFS